jgi:uncharacterized protein
MIDQIWYVLCELSPWLLLGLLIAGVLHVVFPTGFVRRHLGGRGFGNVLKAVLVGIPLPLCSCGVIPMGIGLKRDGASDGACVGFLISTPQTGVDSFLVSASLLSWPFALLKVGAALVTGLVGGLLVDALPHRHVEDDAARGESTRTDRSPREMLRFSFVQLFGDIYGWLAIGVLASGLITFYVPADYFANVPWVQGLGGMLLMLLIALPLYVCAIASVPMAAALVAVGMPPGAALVFLMAGPVTNVATVGAVARAFGGRIAGIYVGTVAVGSVLLGWVFNGVLPTDISGGAMAHIVPPWLAQACAVLVLALILGHTVAWLRRRSAALAPCCAAANAPAPSACCAEDEPEEEEKGGSCCH